MLQTTHAQIFIGTKLIIPLLSFYHRNSSDRNRTTGHGFSAGIGKAGAFPGTLLFPVVMETIGFNITFVIISLGSFTGLITTFVLKEPNGKSLENL